MLNECEQKKYNTISKFVSKEINIKEVMLVLDLKECQIYRLKKIFITEGINGFIHKNRGKENPNKLDEVLIEELENLYLEKHHDFNFEHFYEDYVYGKYNISYDAMLKRFTKDDIISPLAHKKTVKEYKEKMKEVIKENNSEVKEVKVELFKSRIIEAEKAHPRRSSNLYAFGQEVQIDACQKLWFGGIPSFLHLAVDKATKKVLFGWFEYEEITRGYFVVLFHIIINYGIPAKIKADNRSSFSANNAKTKEKKTFMTQFGKACERLNIVLHTTSVSTAKANVERENGTFKNRLIAELRYENITDIDEANRYLNEVFIPKMNSKFAYEIDFERNDMRENTYDFEELNIIISERYSRKIDNSSSIKYKSKYYIPVDIETGEIMSFEQNTVGIIIIAYDNSYWCNIDETIYKLHEIQAPEKKIYQKTTKTQEEINKSKAHKPALNHPWRNYRKS